MASPPDNVSIGAMGAGTSGGTLLVLIANQLPPETVWHTLLVYVAPGVTMLLGAAWIFFRSRFVEFLDQRNAEIVLKKARATLNASLQNNPSPEHTKKLKSTIEELEVLQLRKLAKRMDVDFEPDRT